MRVGRAEARVVGEYLEALRTYRPGRRRTREQLEEKLAQLADRARDTDALTALRLAQQRRDVLAEMNAVSADERMLELQEALVEVAASFSARNAIDYATWREIGVAPSVLTEAGIRR